MRSVYQFLKSTLVGGLVILVPVIVIVAVVGWAGNIALKVVVSVFEWLPDKSVGGVSITVLAAVGSLVAACFIAGLCAELAVIRHLRDRADQLALFVPGYALMKHAGANLVGIESTLKTVLVRFEASWQLGFLMATLHDGRHVVFIPGVPKALVGTLHIIEADRVEVLAISVSAALDVLSRLGVGLGMTWPKETSSV